MISYQKTDSLTEEELKKLYSKEYVYNKDTTGNAALDALMESSKAMNFTKFDFNPN
jgi:ABC-type phosphate transport system substrate-binding protein